MTGIRDKAIETVSLAIGYSSAGRNSVVMENINISAKKGNLVALIGRNGSGKSTLLRTIVALQPAIMGSVLLNGKMLTAMPVAGLPKTISFTSTEPLAVRNLTVVDAISLGRYPYTNWIGSFTDEDKDAITDALDAVELSDLKHRNVQNLSDGERQRVLIARALAQDTDLMVMDEPTAFLDLPSRFSIVNILRRLTREKGKCIVYSTHDLDTALSEADIIWLMTENGIIQGAPEDHILNGVIANAFKGPMLSFNQTTGSFSFIRNRTGEIALEASGLTGKMTEKALQRCGIAINPKAPRKIKVKQENGNTEWCISQGDSLKCFNSIYDMLDHLPGL